MPGEAHTGFIPGEVHKHFIPLILIYAHAKTLIYAHSDVDLLNVQLILRFTINSPDNF